MEARVRIREGEREVELEGSEAFVAELLERHLAGWLVSAPGLAMPRVSATLAPEVADEQAEPTDPFPRVSPTFTPKVNVSLAEFTRMKQAVSPADLVVVTAYYLEKYRRLESFTTADIQAALAELPAWSCREAGEELELPMTLGHIEQLRDGRLSLTFKGQNYVRDGLT
ncbi:MAG: hypothetical protein VKS61_05140 [Candidatus Sericytochromatia bacterium]|nr:hypothetical protein [Candidatus Sericytochromatia bacterium]MEB3221443.1 hypothetical protein [Candidatus Sericytochromatia bacterium]